METQTKQKFTFFWGGTFSQWAPSIFTIDGINFTHAEQYMMYKKAMLFSDTETAKKILEAAHPREQKALGRKVANFNKEEWEKYCKQYVYDANYAKFTQNAEMRKVLMSTGDTELVEASPEDNIWGIGLAEEDPRAQNKEAWLGTNWLGEAITKVREDLKKDNSINFPSFIKPEISIDEFSKVDVRLCQILSVEKVEKKDRLYRLLIDTGIDKRVVVSSIALMFKPEDLQGKTLPFVLNLPPREIAGITSRGMIILADAQRTGQVLQIASNTPNIGVGAIVI